MKETFRRWFAQCGDSSKAAWNTWMQIGYGRTGSSPEQSARLMYHIADRDKMVMNRDRLVSQSIDAIEQINAAGYLASESSTLALPGNGILQEMAAFMDQGITDGLFFPHDKTVAMTVAGIVVNTQGEQPLEVSEEDLFARERSAFIQLAHTKETRARIQSLLKEGKVLRN